MARRIAVYTFGLARQQWRQTCDSMNRQLGCKKSWILFRHFFNPTQSKTYQSDVLVRLLHKLPDSDTDLLADLRHRYLNMTHTDLIPTCEGFPNITFVADLSDAEVHHSLNQLHTTLAQGPRGLKRSPLKH